MPRPIYAYYISARILSILAMQMLSLTLAWTLYEMTDNPFYLGVAGLMLFVPALLLVFVTGMIADRFNRQAVLAACFLVVATCAAMLVILMHQELLAPFGIFAILGVIGVARAFYNPTMKALLVNVVKRGNLPRAIALNSSLSKLASISGPIIGGLLYAVSPELAFGVAGIFAGIAAILSLLIRNTTQERSVAPVSVRDFSLGLRSILGDRVLFGAMSLDLCAILLGGAVALIPVYARDILGVGAAEAGFLRAAPAVGALLVAAALAWRPIMRYAGAIMLVTIAAYGMCIVVFGLSTNLWLSLIALAGSGGFDMVSIFVRETLIQSRTPDQVRGRVNAINSVFNSGANELGDFRAGSMAALTGAVPAVVAGGLCSVAVAALWSWWFPEFRQLKILDAPAQPLVADAGK